MGKSVSLSCALVALGLLVSACGGSSASPGVASIGSAATTTSSPSVAQGGSSSTNYLDAVNYSNCMRSHGVPNFPDPTSNGNFLMKAGVLNGQRVDPNSSQYVKANKACQHLLPNGGKMTAAQQQEALASALKFVHCLRTHGLPNTPDPITSGGGVAIRLSGPGPNSPQVQKALKACRSLAPGGGP